MKPFGLPAFMSKAFGSNFSNDFDLVKVPNKRYVAFVEANGLDAELPQGMYKWDTVRVPRADAEPEPDKKAANRLTRTTGRRWSCIG
jgi:hypothetical protein